MDTSEKRFERDIESFLISEQGGFIQFNGQNADGKWVKTRQHDVDKCIYMDVLCEFIEKTQPKEWDKYKKYYGDNAPEKLYNRLEQTISNEVFSSEETSIVYKRLAPLIKDMPGKI